MKEKAPEVVLMVGSELGVSVVTILNGEKSKLVAERLNLFEAEVLDAYAEEERSVVKPRLTISGCAVAQPMSSDQQVCARL
jgi:hypothetical protein